MSEHGEALGCEQGETSIRSQAPLTTIALNLVPHLHEISVIYVSLSSRNEMVYGTESRSLWFRHTTHTNHFGSDRSCAVSPCLHQLKAFTPEPRSRAALGFHLLIVVPPGKLGCIPLGSYQTPSFPQRGCLRPIEDRPA